MRAHAKGILLALFMVIGLMWVSEASAAVPSGGSRLLFYFTKKGFASGAANDSAQTLLFITNGNTSLSTRVGIKYYRADCAVTIGPVFQNIAAGQTLTVDVAAQAPAFQEGVAEAFFANASDQPERNDWGAGWSVIIDRSLLTVLRLSAAAVHSDNRLGTPGTTISDNNALSSWAPILLTGSFANPSLVTTRLALFGPGTVSGTTSSGVATANFRQPSGGGAVDGPFNTQCGRSLTLATVRGQTEAQFQASFPDGGTVAPSVSGQDKGLVGWLIEVIQLGGGIDILFGQTLQGIGTADPTAHP